MLEQFSRARSTPAARAAEPSRPRGIATWSPDRSTSSARRSIAGPPPMHDSAATPTADREITDRESPQSICREQAQRHPPVRDGAVRRRDLLLGQPQAGAPPRHRVPGVHHRRALPRRRLVGRRPAGDPTHRARRRIRPAPRGHPVDIVELDLARGDPVHLRDRCEGHDDRHRRCPGKGDAARFGQPDRPGTGHQRIAGGDLVDRGDRAQAASIRSPRSPAGRSSRKSPRSRASPEPI